MPTAVLFDVDGTLVTFRFDVQGARNALLAELPRMGLRVNGLAPDSRIQEIVESARRQAEEAGSGFSSYKDRIYGVLDEFEERSARESTVFPRARETLGYLRSRSVRLGVLTNSGKKAARSVLGKGDMLGFFEFVLTREDVEEMKPSPEGLLRAVRDFSLPKGEVCYVGDGILDIIAAKKAGLKIVSVATGNYPMDRLREEGADFVISSLAELPGALEL